MKVEAKDLENLKIIEEYVSKQNIEEIKKQVQIKRRITKNQEVGKHIEEIFKKILEPLPQPFKLEKIKRGGPDFAVVDENDVLEDGQEAVYTIAKILIEVKSTIQDKIEMTLPQAKAAVDNANNFILCVVEIPENQEVSSQIVKENSYFIFGLGPKLEEKLHRVKESSKSIESLAPTTDEIGVVAQGLSWRFVIPRKYWINGMKFEQFKLTLEDLLK
jgi:hypothetical protein